MLGGAGGGCRPAESLGAWVGSAVGKMSIDTDLKFMFEPHLEGELALFGRRIDRSQDALRGIELRLFPALSLQFGNCCLCF